MNVQSITIGDCVKVIGGFAFKSKDFGETGKPVIRISNIQNGIVDTEKAVRILPEKVGKGSRATITGGDILMALSGATTGKVGVVPINIDGPVYLNQRVGKFEIVNNMMIERAYLRHYLESGVIQSQVWKSAAGVAQPNISPKQLEAYQIPLPPISEQKRIATILDKADALREKRRQAIAKLDELLQSVFLDMFGDPVKNPKGWDKVKFGEIIETLTDYHANGSYKILKKHVELRDIPDFALMIRTTDLESNNFIDGVKYITKDAYDFLAKSKVFGEEIIINKIGSAGEVYYMPLLNRPVSLGMNQFLIRTTDQALAKYVYQYLKTPCGDSLIKSKVHGAVTKTITKDAVRDVDIILPPLTQQHEFIEKLTCISKFLECNKRHLNKLDTFFASLQQRAFKGEL